LPCSGWRSSFYNLSDKYYLGFYQDGALIAVMDLISGYPNAENAFIGFFMTAQETQGKGVGSSIIAEICQFLKQAGFSFVRLGYAKGNLQSEAFWMKNKFEQTGEEVSADGYVLVVMQRCL
jgi:RimJ/RimL family protein N-acetyltransferase